MTHTIARNSSSRGKSNRTRKPQCRQLRQSPRGNFGPRVKQVGAEKYAIVRLDPAKGGICVADG